MITGVRGRAAKHQRNPSPVGQQRQLCPGFSAVDGAGAAAITAAKRPHVSRVDQYDTTTQTAALTEQGQQPEMHVLPHPQLLPQLQTSPSGFTATPKLTRDVLPATTDSQHKPDHFQHDRMRDRWPPSLTPRGLCPTHTGCERSVAIQRASEMFERHRRRLVDTNAMKSASPIVNQGNSL